MTDQQEPGFGDIWVVSLGDADELRLVVSGAFYHSIQPHTVVVVPIDPQLRTVTLFSANLEGYGWAALDRPTTVFRHRLQGFMGAIPFELHEKVRGTMRLIFDITGD